MVKALRAYYEHEHGDNGIVLETAQDVDRLIDDVRDKYADEWEVLINVTIADDPYGPWLNAGVNENRGTVVYGGGKPPVIEYSKGDSVGSDSELVYYYMGSSTDLPPDAEVSLDVVRQAVKEFAATAGQRPSCVQWQPVDGE